MPPFHYDRIFMLLLVLVFYLGRYPFRYLRRSYRQKKLDRVFTDKSFDYDRILTSYNPYYKSLPATDRDRFLKRVLVFMDAKDFKYIDIEEEERMPLLISAAAVQLTFGLDSYLLDYFDTIYVLRNNYRYGSYATPFEGHVSEEGIYLSWNNFLREFNNYNDGENLGLHEMAHALTYVNFTVTEGRDNAFHDKFKDFSTIARPVFERMQAGETTLLNAYAATNYQEFWAVSIETFFERAASFKIELPDLYFALSNLLNQDPLNPAKVLSFSETA